MKVNKQQINIYVRSLFFAANAATAKMIFLILILWIGISEQRSPEVQLRPEVETTSAEVTVTSVQRERTEWSPTTVKSHEQSMHTQPDVTIQPTEPEVTGSISDQRPNYGTVEQNIGWISLEKSLVIFFDA